MREQRPQIPACVVSHVAQNCVSFYDSARHRGSCVAIPGPGALVGTGLQASVCRLTSFVAEKSRGVVYLSLCGRLFLPPRLMLLCFMLASSLLLGLKPGSLVLRLFPTACDDESAQCCVVAHNAPLVACLCPFVAQRQQYELCLLHYYRMALLLFRWTICFMN